MMFKGFTDGPDLRPFACDWESCNKDFKRRSDLTRHYKIHTNERPHPCTAPGCEKRFIQRSALAVHTRTHTGEKPHKCKYPGCIKSRLALLDTVTYTLGVVVADAHTSTARRGMHLDVLWN
ncbi:hypothetical protein N5P37_010392 [Trichoderma harzianum]|nr:hypothetical protein N5P37_010392 [Trichoderma harzianum]